MPMKDAHPWEPSVAPAIELVQPVEGAAVTGGQVAVTLRTAAHQRVHVSVLVGGAVLGWRGVTTGPDGTWAGYVEVFAPSVTLPATVRAVVVLPQGAVEVTQTISLNGGGAVVLWNVSLVSSDGHRPDVEFSASAPLRFAHVSAWLTDAANGRIGQTAGGSFVDIWRVGSAAGRALGLGTVSGTIPVRRRVVGQLVLHLAWRDPVTGVRGSLHQPFYAGDAVER